MIKLVVMLGNPGVQYKNTRHNAGFMFCSYLGLPDAWQTKFHGKFQKSKDTVYLKPETYMNESGISVQEAAKFFGIKTSDIIVVHDDIETEFSIAKIQKGGGLGGHNGLRSIKQHLSSDEFWRLKIGVGRPKFEDVASYVLGHFSELDEKILEDTFAKAKVFLDKYLEG